VIRVGVIGACGRMGLMVCRAVAEADDLALVAAIDRSRIGENVGALIGQPKLGIPVSDELERLLEAEAAIAIDFTHPDVVMENVRWCIDHGVHLVVGTTGITQEDLQSIEKAIVDEGSETHVIVASNFALGAVARPDAGEPRRRPRRGFRWDPRAFGSSAGPRRPPGGHLRRAGADAHDPSRLDRPKLVHPRRPDGGARRDDAARPHGGPRTAARPSTRRLT
jgi:NAD(P)-dependent dehydrogenase (short-subunit alcohol dehydrogenase family)